MLSLAVSFVSGLSLLGARGRGQPSACPPPSCPVALLRGVGFKGKETHHLASHNPSLTRGGLGSPFISTASRFVCGGLYESKPSCRQTLSVGVTQTAAPPSGGLCIAAAYIQDFKGHTGVTGLSKSHVTETKCSTTMFLCLSSLCPDIYRHFSSKGSLMESDI